ncbi:hypothetical protein P170DRAFT_474575 [Aspergillus steynii IBT 23096]|uniref:Uncharacterized protein n=1 Tax=Aspergillus steynii IBT 23096 TaxID=1392250 RepID=A0A2I2GDQ0_9EURO|nr:uncharacterized protein P170DRAFT_474575 [Aspergillus steynii IBT 23096]PLB51029.1 hypothetical protein P170DRAFT_474575 [Aspergillus steynii IBT 23096]
MAVPPLPAVDGTISTLSTLESIICRRGGATRMGQALASREITCIPARFGVTVDEQTQCDGAQRVSLSPPRIRYSVAEALAEYPAVNLSFRRCFIGPRQHPLPAHNQVTALYVLSGSESRLRRPAYWTEREPFRRLQTGSSSVLQEDWQNGPFNFQPLQTLVLGPSEGLETSTPPLTNPERNAQKVTPQRKILPLTPLTGIIIMGTWPEE